MTNNHNTFYQRLTYIAVGAFITYSSLSDAAVNPHRFDNNPALASDNYQLPKDFEPKNHINAEYDQEMIDFLRTIPNIEHFIPRLREIKEN